MARLIACDVCHKQVNVYDLTDDSTWAEVVLLCTDERGLTFCSPSCMADWAVARSAQEVTRG